MAKVKDELVNAYSSPDTLKALHSSEPGAADRASDDTRERGIDTVNAFDLHNDGDRSFSRLLRLAFDDDDFEGASQTV